MSFLGPLRLLPEAPTEQVQSIRADAGALEQDPVEMRTASANRVAQTSSQINNAADESGSRRGGGILDICRADQASDFTFQSIESRRRVELVDLKG